MENLETKDSLAIISAIISERQQKYEQNGLVFIFWGILIAVSGIVNFITKSPLVWGVLMPLSSVITSVYFYIEGRNNVKKRKSKDWVSFIWLVAGICAMLTGFSVSYHLIVTIVFLPFVFASLAVSLQLKNRLWLVTSLISLVLSYLPLYVEIGWYSTLVSSLIGILLFLIPGCQFYFNHKRQKNV